MLLKMENSLNRRGNMPFRKATFYHKKKKIMQLNDTQMHVYEVESLCAKEKWCKFSVYP